jgi:DNA replication protein DnaC
MSPGHASEPVRPAPAPEPARPAPGDRCAACGTPLDVRTLDFPLGLGPRTFALECPCARAAREAATHEAERAAAALRRRVRLAASGIPARFAGATLAAADGTAPGRATLLAACRALVASDAQAGRGLVLLGDPGTGKTYLAAAVTRALIDRDVDAVFVSLPQLVLGGRARAPEAASAFDVVLDRARTCAHLWLDDVGRERPTDWARAVLALLLDGRYAAGLATSLAAALSPRALQARLGAALARRVAETTTIHWCPGETRRPPSWIPPLPPTPEGR